MRFNDLFITGHSVSFFMHPKNSLYIINNMSHFHKWQIPRGKLGSTKCLNKESIVDRNSTTLKVVD